MLETLVALLAATALAVPLSRHLGLGSIIGYLVAGAVIGPSGLRLVTDLGQIGKVAEFGVVMLLFLIGLELRPHRLWILRRTVFGLGLGQMAPTALLLAGLARAAGEPWPAACILGLSLALSSTAIVLPMLGERELLSAPAGRDSFAVLLLQDIAFIPLVALVPLLAGAPVPDHVPWLEVLRALTAVAAILVGGTLLVPFAFRAIGGARTPEVFTATALLLVAGTAALADWAGLSMSLGAFMAGVMLSDSEWRHEVQADIRPFQGLLLGFFFISVGMSADFGLALRAPGAVALGVLALLAAKAAAAFVVGLIKRRSARSAVRFALALAEGSEFAFVVFGAAVAAGALARETADLATLVVALSMLAVPALFAASERLLMPHLERREAQRRAATPRREPRYDRIDAVAPVIICGFGRVGQIVGRVLRMQRIPFVALDTDPALVETVRRFGGRVFFGDPGRPDVMRAAGATTARVLVVAIADPDEALRVADVARRNFPHLAVLARARNRRHAHLLMDLGVQGIVRETFHSSLVLTEHVLEHLGVPRETAERAITLFRDHDERQLAESHGVAADEEQLIQSAKQAAQELQELFEADPTERANAND